MEPNWTICILSALIDETQKPFIHSVSTKIWLKIHFFIIIASIVSNQVVKYSARFPSSSTKTNKKNAGHGMIGVLYTNQQNLISRKVIWFELPKSKKKNIFVV